MSAVAASPPGGPPASWTRLAAPAGAVACIALTVALAAGHVAGSGAVALGGVGFALVLLWCLIEPSPGRALVVFALYVGMLDGYLKLRTGSRGLTAARDLLLWVIAAAALLRAMHRGESLRLPPLGLVVLGFAGLVLVELANPSTQGFTQSLGGVRQHLEFVPLFFLGYAFIRTREELEVLLLVLVVVAAANGVVSAVQSTLTPEQLAGWGAGYRERIFGEGIFTGQNKVGFEVVDGVVIQHVRPFGLGSELGAGAVVAALAIPGLIALLFSQSGWRRVLLIACVPAIALGVATAGSRAAVLACFVSVLAFAGLAMTSRNAKRVLAAVLAGAVLVAGIFIALGPSNDAVRRARSVTLTNFIETFDDERGKSVRLLDDYIGRYPLGAGVGTVGPAAQALSETAPELNAETQWNLSVVETGIAGLVLLLGLGATLIVLSVTRIRRIADAEQRLMLSALAAPLVAIFALSFATATTVSAPTAPYLWLVAGILSFWLMGRGPDGADHARSRDEPG